MHVFSIDNIKNLYAFIRSRVFLINLLVAIGLITITLASVGVWLSVYTNHGKTVSVPDFKGLKPEQLDNFVREKDVNYKIVDSIYNPKLPKGVVVDQDPAFNFKVKQNRTIYLTVNIYVPPKVKIPNLIDVPQKQAEAILQTYGLKIGQLIYEPNLTKNTIMGLQIHGSPIATGSSVNKGTVIDLVLGDGVGDTRMGIPNLLSLSYQEALVVIKGSGLTVGGTYFDETVKDSTLARVYKQNPPYTTDTTQTIGQGQAMDIYLTQSPEKLKAVE